MKPSDILLCADFDNTLSYGGIPEANVRAIKAFMAVGGLFTLSTGRDGKSVLGEKMPFVPNAPMIGLTGAELFDLREKRRVRVHFLEPGWEDILRELAVGVPWKQIFEIVYEDGAVEGPAEELEDLIAAGKGKRAVKLVSSTDYSGGELFPPEAAEICRGRCNVTSNGYTSYEMTPLGVDKGTAAGELKALTGAKILVCVGDYAGDIPMLRAADIGYAVENAADAVKSAADRVTVHAKDGAIAAILGEIL